MKSTRSSFGLSSRSDQTTDTSDLFEILEPPADHRYEIEQFQEIPDNSESYLIEEEQLDDDFDGELVKIERVEEQEEINFEEFE